MAPAPEGVPRAGAEPHGAPGPAAADERVLDHGPCSSPGCTHIGVRLYGRHCPNHVLGWVAAAFGWVEAAALARPDPLEANPLEAAIEAGVREATAVVAWWRYPDKAYIDIAKLCLALIERRGEWPVTHPPTSTDVGKEIALSKKETPHRRDGRRVFDALKSAKRRTGHPHRFKEALADACAEYERALKARQRMP